MLQHSLTLNNFTTMKKTGQVLFVIGIIATVASIFMDTSVSTGYYDKGVNNIGLLNDRTNYVTTSCFLTLIGAIWIAAGNIIEALANNNETNSYNYSTETTEEVQH